MKQKLKKLMATIVVATMSVSLIPKIIGKDAVLADVVKSQSNTCLGTSKIAAPVAPESDDAAWLGSYVYYGAYNENPIKFRVLAPNTTAYGGTTLFLESDSVLFDREFDNDSKVWSSSDLRTYLNDEFLTGGSFTGLEQTVIASSTAAEHRLVVGDGPGQVAVRTRDCYGYYVALSGEKIFILDAEEISNVAYGYGFTNDISVSRKKGEWDLRMWIRSAEKYYDPYLAGCISRDGSLSGVQVYSSFGVAPALNVSLDKILFSTTIDGAMGEVGSSYKLTILDDSLSVNAGSVSLSGTTFSCKATGNADQLSLLITDGAWNASDSNIKYYGAYNGSFDLSSIDLNAADWGINYHVYLIAEDINGDKVTDCASTPVEVSKSSVTVTFNTNGNGTAPVAQTVVYGNKATKPADPIAAGYAFGGWYTDSACTKAYDFDSEATADITLYAKWTATPTTPPSPPPKESEKSFEDFVERLYTVALNRPSEPEGKAFWCEHVGNGDLNGAQCANEFLLSKEFKDRNLSDEEFLKVLYKTFFDRDAANDPDGFNFWMNCLKTQGRDSVVDCFINSEEWCNVCASYGVKSGATRAKATVASKNATAFATRLYTECLGRDPETDGLNFWSLGLTNLELTGKQAAHEFFFSKEFNDHNFDNKELLTRMYRTFMGREPDDDGMNFWLNNMKNGMTKEDVFNEFVKSKEFTEICQSYAIDRG
ncbi:MAG: DUF4214 domain-containing protein [Clostridiales bacterium]|nr:DUF4214 domain-containing protein [Clostridiales bacterium]